MENRGGATAGIRATAATAAVTEAVTEATAGGVVVAAGVGASGAEGDARCVVSARTRRSLSTTSGPKFSKNS